MNLFNFLFGNIGATRKVVTQQTADNILSDWKTISVSLAQKTPSFLRNALITADKSLDNALGDLVDGESMGDRLKNATNLFSRDLYSKIWDAHKIRNNLVHASGYEPPHFVVTEAIQTFKLALQTLGLRI
jgi:hypothetical protein